MLDPEHAAWFVGNDFDPGTVTVYGFDPDRVTSPIMAGPEELTLEDSADTALARLGYRRRDGHKWDDSEEAVDVYTTPIVKL